jgi:hypothetical protein
VFFFAVTAALLLTSTLVGYGVFVTAHRLRRRWVTAIIGVGCTFLLLIAAAIVYLTIGETPANNERVGSEQRFVIEISEVDGEIQDRALELHERRSSVERAAFSQPPSFRPPRVDLPTRPVVGRIEVLAPTAVTPREDFSLALSIWSSRQFPNDVRAVRLSAPRSAEVRSLDVCAATQENQLAVCSTPVENTFHVAWDVTPTEPGQLLFTIGVPSDLMPQSGLSKWEAVAVGPWGSGGRGESPTMSASSPSVTWQGVSVDLLAGQLRVPVTVVDTLGVSRNVYNGLAFIGTLLSGLLGSGWLWKLLEWGRTRSISKRKRPVGAA